MKYVKSTRYDTPELNRKIMGPNPVKLEEELLQNHRIPAHGTVCDLGSGQGLTSVFLAKEYGFYGICGGFVERSGRKPRVFPARWGFRMSRLSP